VLCYADGLEFRFLEQGGFFLEIHKIMVIGFKRTMWMRDWWREKGRRVGGGGGCLLLRDKAAIFKNLIK
jgi:hypothetical protein